MKYFLLNLKRLLRALPLVLIVSFLLISIVMTVLSQFSSIFKSEQESRFKVAIAGNTNSRLFNFGLVALKTLDSSRFSIDVEPSDEQTAKKQLLGGEISAYVVVPDNFIKYAKRGKIIPLTYYTTASTVDISGLMRDEITNVISVMLKESQKAVFGEEQLLIENGYEDLLDVKPDELNFKYIDFIVDRAKMYNTEIIGVSYGLDLVQNLLIGNMVIFVCVLAIPFSCLLIRRDNSIIKTLSAAGKGSGFSAISEYAAMFFAFISTLVIIGLLSLILSGILKYDIFSAADIDFGKAAFSLVPIVAMTCAFSFMIQEMSGNILSNVIGFFFISMALCYISGCMYPLYALPPVLQKIAAFTPTGAARSYISLSLTGNNGRIPLISILGYTLLFLFAAIQVRKYKLSRGDGA